MRGISAGERLILDVPNMEDSEYLGGCPHFMCTLKIFIFGLFYADISHQLRQCKCDPLTSLHPPRIWSAWWWCWRQAWGKFSGRRAISSERYAVSLVLYRGNVQGRSKRAKLAALRRRSAPIGAICVLQPRQRPISRVMVKIR